VAAGVAGWELYSLRWLGQQAGVAVMTTAGCLERTCSPTGRGRPEMAPYLPRGRGVPAAWAQTMLLTTRHCLAVAKPLRVPGPRMPSDLTRVFPLGRVARP
jgi:hypothetical protein